MDFLIIHEYYTKVSSADPSRSNLLNYGCITTTAGPNCGPAAIAQRVKADLHKYAPEHRASLPVMITEYNMEQPYQAETWSLLEGLFVARHLGDSMQSQLMGSTFFALANGKMADYGMFSRDPKPIAYAPVFSFAIFTRVAPVGSTMLSIPSDPIRGVPVYAYSLPNQADQAGFYGLVLVNTRPETVNVSLSGPWGQSSDLAATIYKLGAKPGSDDANRYAATSFAYNGVSGPSKGGPFPLSDIPPQRTLFTGSVTLDAVSVTGLVIGPSSAPFPPPTPAPPAPPSPSNECCHASCDSGQCKSTGFCVQAQSNCERQCAGVWCPKY